MPWQITILLHVLLSAIGTVLARKLSIKGNKYGYSVLLFLFLTIWLLGIVVSFFLEGSVVAPRELYLYGFLVLGGLLFSLRNYLVLEMYQYVTASVGSIIAVLNTLSVVLVATLFIDESLNATQLLGAAFMLLAVYLASQAKVLTNKQKKLHKKGLLIGVINSLIFGIAVTNEKFLLDELGAETYLVFGWGFQLLGALVIIFVNRKKFVLPRVNKAYMLAYVLIFAAGGGLFIASLVGSDNSSLIASLSGLKVIITVLLAYIFLKERHKMSNVVLASLLAFAGLFLLLR